MHIRFCWENQEKDSKEDLDIRRWEDNNEMDLTEI
jgi:hypothetical protein